MIEMINVTRPVASIEDSIDRSQPFESVTDRYYSRYYQVDPDRSRRHDFCVLIHSNKICLLSLAPSHPILTTQPKIHNIDYDVSKTVNRQTNKASGKSKKGAQLLGEKSILCRIETKSGEDIQEWPVQACVKGKLIGMNKALVDQPDLLVTQPWAEGHLAVVLLGLRDVEEVKKALLDQQAYDKVIKEEENS